MKFTNTDEYIIANDVIISYVGKNEAALTIPAEINGIKIRRIGNGAFYGCDSVAEIVVSEGISEIGEKAFAKCFYLRKLTLPQSVTVIEKDILKNTELNVMNFYISLPYQKYKIICEGSIALENGGYIFDPMSLGESVGKQIRGYMNGFVSERFSVDRKMGCLYLKEKDPKTGATHIYSYGFKDYCRKYNLDHKVLNDRSRAFLKRVENKDYDFWFEHDEDYDDSYRNPVNPNDDAALLFLQKEGAISDKGIHIGLQLKKGKFFFQRGSKVCIDGEDYYVRINEFLTNSKKRPYWRSSRVEVYTDRELLEMTDERRKAVINKLDFLSTLI